MATGEVLVALADAGLPDGLFVETDPESGDIHLVGCSLFSGIQFHAESILTQNGFGILRDLVTDLIS